MKRFKNIFTGFVILIVLAATFTACTGKTGNYSNTFEYDKTDISGTLSTPVSNTPQIGTDDNNHTAINTEYPETSQEPVSTGSGTAEKPGVTSDKGTVSTAKPGATTSGVTNTVKPEKTETPVLNITEAPSENTGGYSEVKEYIIKDDAVAGPVTLDGKVPANIKNIYDTVKNALLFENVSGKGEKKISFSTGISKEELQDAIYYVKNYNPELFYVYWNKYSYSTMGGKVLSVTLDILSTADSYKEVIDKADQIVAEANKKPNLFERELYIHDWMIKNIEYNISSQNSGDIYGALIEGKARCEGYARAFQYLMNKIGVETVLITGTADGESHMWNMVKLYGKYYFVDVTHDDPLPDSKIPDGKEYLINHSCLNINSELLEKTHVIDKKGETGEDGLLKNADLKACTDMTYNYYKVRGLAASDMDQVKYVLDKNRENCSVEIFYDGKMPDIETFKKVFSEFMKDRYPQKGYSYSYTSQTSNMFKRNVIRISWTIK